LPPHRSQPAPQQREGYIDKSVAWQFSEAGDRPSIDQIPGSGCHFSSSMASRTTAPDQPDHQQQDDYTAHYHADAGQQQQIRPAGTRGLAISQGLDLIYGDFRLGVAVHVEQVVAQGGDLL